MEQLARTPLSQMKMGNDPYQMSPHCQTWTKEEDSDAVWQKYSQVLLI